MKLFYDLRLGYFVAAPGQDVPQGELYGKSGDEEEVVIQFGRSTTQAGTIAIIQAPEWTAENLPPGTVVTIGIKESGAYSDGQALSITSEFVNDAVEKTYTFTLDLNTTEINTALGRLDAAEGNDIEALDCNFECTLQLGGAGGWKSSSINVPFTINHDIIGGSEGTPSSAENPEEYLLKQSAIEWLPTVANTHGGTSSDLDAIPSVSMDEFKSVGFYDSGSDEIRLYRLRFGPETENIPSVVIPDDYDPVTNAKYWELMPTNGGAAGTVTSVAITGSDGIEVDAGSPITTSGTIALGINASTLKTHISLGNVENTALSTWAGSSNITTIGTIATGTVPVANVSGLGDAATKNVGTTAGTVAAGDHTHSQLHDPVTVADSSSIDLTLTGQQISAAAIFGSSAGTVCQGNDARLSDARTPTSHTHDDRYYTETETDSLLAGKAAASHTHATSEVTGLDSALAGKAAASHTHATSEVTGLDSALAGKAAASHTHNASAIDAGTIDPARLPVAGLTTIGGVKRNAGAAGQFIKGFDTDGSAMYDEPASLVYRPGWNLLRNGNCAVQQRGVLFDSTGGRNNDGAYTYDGWYILSDGNNVIGIDGGKLKAEIKTANKKFGLTQILEFKDTAAVREFSVTFSFSAVWLIGAVTHVKAAILGWTGTADAPTHDFISSWNGDDTLPTLATNWEYLNTPANLNVTSDGTYYSVSASPNSTHKNLAVFVWSDTTSSTIGRILSLDEMQLEVGGSRTSFQYVPYVDNLARCQRYYEVMRYSSWGVAAMSSYRSAGNYTANWQFKVQKIKQPTVSLVTGSWAGGVPPIYPGIDHVDFYGTVVFYASGTSGNVALAASAEF